MSDTLTVPTTDEITVTTNDDGDHERFAHYVKIHALVAGGECVALCGKRWVPRKDPGRFPVCPTCLEVFESMPPGGDDV